MTDREAIESAENELESTGYTLETNNKLRGGLFKILSTKFEFFITAKSALQEREERSKGCRFCFDATLEPDLEGCDLSYHDVGKSAPHKRIMFRAGDKKPMAIMFEEWSGNQWHTVGIYETKFCPECGRPLKGADND